MIGMNAITGRALSGLDHIYQSIGKILTTPRGSRLQRREFGAEIFDRIDAPSNQANLVRIYAAAATALMRHEPRLQLRRFALVELGSNGTAMFDIEGIATETGQTIATSVAVSMRGLA